MAHIERRRRASAGGSMRTTWRARHTAAGDGRERSRTFDRRLDAERWLAAVQVAKTRGEWLDPALARVSVGEWADRWLASKVGLKASTRESYESLLRSRVLPRWSAVPLAAVTHADVATWVAELSSGGLGASRVRKAVVVLAGLLELAVRDGRLTRNATTGVDLPRLPAKRDRAYLTHADVGELATACGSDGPAVLVLAYCGLRFGELAGMRVRDLDLLRGRLTVARGASEVAGRMVIDTPKGHRARWVPLPRFLRDVLAGQIGGRAPDEPAFPAPEGGLLREGNFRRRSFDPAVQHLGLEPLTPHELRHVAASLAVSAGANVKAVQRMLGHSSAVMTLDLYADLFDDDLEAVAVRLDEAARSFLPRPHDGPAPVRQLWADRQKGR